MSATEIEFEAERDIDHGDEIRLSASASGWSAIEGASGGSGTHPVPVGIPFNVPRRVRGGWVVKLKHRRAA